MAYSDPYEEWKQSGRPGGTYKPPTAVPPPPPGAAPAPAPGPMNIPPPPRAQPAAGPAPAAPAPGGSLSNTPFGDLSGFKDYASWQAANKAGGGSGDSAQIRALFGGPSADTGGQALPGGGTTQYTGPADTTKWRTDVAMTDNAHPDAAGPSGDPFVDMIRSGNHGSEDFQRFSNAQILAWKGKYDEAASKAAGKPMFRNDFGDLVEKPTESGAKSQAAGYATGERDAGRAGGGGGGGGGGGAAGVGAGGAGGGGDLSSLMESNLKQMLSGSGSRYSPEAMQGLLAAVKQRVESSKRNQLRQSQSDAASRGMARSGASLARADQIRRGAEAEFTGEYANTLRAKIDADRQDKIDALDRSQRYLDSMRDELYRRDMSAVQRQQFKANLDLAYANIKNQRQMLTASAGYNMLAGGQ